MTNEVHSIKSLLMDLIDDVRQLIRQELQLAQAEATEKVSQLQTGAISIVAGLLIAFCALLVLLQALVLALSNVLAPWLAAVIVGVVVAALAFTLIKIGQHNIKTANLKPERTIKSMREDKDMVMERVR